MAMDHNASVSWSEQMPGETLMAHANEDDFSTFLEFGLDFADLEGHGSPAVHQHQHHQRPAIQHPDHSIATSMADEARIGSDHASPYAPVVPSHLPAGIPNNAPIEDQTFHFSHEQQQQQQQQRQQQQQQQQQQQMVSHNHPQLALQHHDKYPPHTTAHPYPDGQHVIPPTPNSVELHGGAARYPQRVDMGGEIYDRYGQMNDEQAAFYTPLVSPAMTPLETQFRLPEYTIPGEYFTPLTSPALEPQGSNTNGFPFQQTKQPPSTQAQVDPTTSMTMASAPSSPAVLRRQRRRPSTATRAGGRAAKASPSIQPKNWRKQAMTTQLVADDLANGLGQDARPPTSGGSSLRYSGHESSQDSVSPEPISEPLMPPPAVPRRSPAFRPQAMESDSSAPATPATLMRINNRPQEPTGQFSGFASLVPNDPQDELMEDVVLPEAATAVDVRPRPSRIDTAINTKEQHSAHSTPATDPKSATERPPSGSLTPAPRAGTMPSPSGPIAKKSDSKATNGRKRHSVSSSHASPALRPRISPSIQPLVRGEGMTGESSALYLASKSNYQHILDGTLLPGVSYPESLAENLSSKRTNHKLAEQGRRNRINTALKEIEALLPPGFARDRAAKESKETGTGKSGDKEKDKNGQQTISKASTVEMAIDYIKSLQQELSTTKSQLNIAVSKLAAQNSNSPSSAANSTDAAIENSVSPA
ncbi:Phosphorus acquisition-controlling protein [Talaromyces islandicus]|uniref:Phosphorus acquisition-controlling protein n=1 Tax=Talaromyces islandicus TaxID=28573 RepID=A0A0U1LTC2_TALIS|nr:Phosphorus acquisition-controlling protein [Talaromyces islandicus]